MLRFATPSCLTQGILRTRCNRRMQRRKKWGAICNGSGEFDSVMTKVLVTGATGVVGRQIIHALDSADLKLLPVIRAGRENMVLGISNIERVISTPDLFAESESWWEKRCHGIDILIRAAWFAEPGKYSKALQNIDCLSGSFSLVKGAAKVGVKRFICIGRNIAKPANPICCGQG